jgi:hypothetical protein
VQTEELFLRLSERPERLLQCEDSIFIYKPGCGEVLALTDDRQLDQLIISL